MAGKSKIVRGAFGNIIDAVDIFTHRANMVNKEREALEALEKYSASKPWYQMTEAEKEAKLAQQEILDAFKDPQNPEELAIAEKLMGRLTKDFLEKEKGASSTGAFEAIADFDLENLMSFQKSKDDITDLTKKMYPDYNYEADAKGAFGMDHKGYISEVGSDILDMYFAKNSTLDDVSGMAAMDGGVDYLSPILKELEGKGFSKDQIFEIFTNNGAYVPNDELF